MERLLDGPREPGVSPADREAARSLPEEARAIAGTAAACAIALVNRHWHRYPPAERRQLAQLLVFLIPGWRWPGPNVDRLRDESERTVIDWLGRRNRRAW